MRPAVAAALLLLAACSAPLRTAVPADEAARRRPENQAGVMVGKELVRFTWLPAISANASQDAAAFAGIGGGQGHSWLVASEARGGGSVLTFSGPAHDWQRDLLSLRDDLWPALRQARDASPFHQPLETRLGGSTVWAVGDLVPVGLLRPGGESLATVELHDSDPRRATSTRPPEPAAVLVVARRAPGGEEVRRADLGIISRRDGFFTVARLERTAEGKLAALEFAPWRADVKAVLAGQAAPDVLGAGHGRLAEMEQLLTDALVEWKGRELQGWAGGATAAQLEDAVVGAEKGMLQLDLKSRVLKDAIDAAARQGAGSQPGLTQRAQLLDQRKAVIGAVLGTLKSARAARFGGGGR